jgi:hypothetical protein
MVALSFCARPRPLSEDEAGPLIYLYGNARPLILLSSLTKIRPPSHPSLNKTLCSRGRSRMCVGIMLAIISVKKTSGLCACETRPRFINE